MVIETVDLGKRFGNHWANKGICISVGEGRVFALLGANGAGKSTLVKTLVGLSRPSEGKAYLLGKPVGDKESRRSLGFLPEGFRYHEWLSAGEVVDLHGRLYGMSAGDRARMVPLVLSRVGLGGAMGQRVRTFSKGMQQRLGLACALVNGPRVVFLDEPTSALDPIGRMDVRGIIADLRESGTTVFLNSHLLSEVEMVCDQVAFIRKGRIVTQGALTDLLSDRLDVDLRFKGDAEPVYLALAPFGALAMNGEPTGDGLMGTLTLRDGDMLPEIAPAILAAGADLLAMTPRKRSLEQLFVELVREG